MIRSVLKRVYSQPRYWGTTIGVSFVVMSGAILLPNKEVLWQIMTSGTLGFIEKLSFFISIYGSIHSGHSSLSTFYLIGISILFGINIALLSYYVRQRKQPNADGKIKATSAAGLVSGVLGIGCAACGSIVITSVLGLFGVGGLLTALPLEGAEFGIAGLVLLSISIYYLIRQINNPLVCNV